MTDAQWIAGSAVIALMDSATDKLAALDELDNGVMLRTIAARYASGYVDRVTGGRQALKGAPIKPKLWKRVRHNLQARDAFERRELKLPASAGDPATILRDLTFNERDVRLALVPYGIPAPAPLPVPKGPRKRSGGHNMAAHGAVISSITIELLNSPIEAVRKHTEASLAEVLANRFKNFDANREHISLANRTRMARHVLANVLPEMERRALSKAAT